MSRILLGMTTNLLEAVAWLKAPSFYYLELNDMDMRKPDPVVPVREKIVVGFLVERVVDKRLRFLNENFWIPSKRPAVRFDS